MTSHLQSMEHSDMELQMTEKGTISHTEFQSSGMDPDDAAFLTHFSEDQRRKTIRNVDVSSFHILQVKTSLT